MYKLCFAPIVVYVYDQLSVYLCRSCWHEKSYINLNLTKLFSSMKIKVEITAKEVIEILVAVVIILKLLH